MCWCNVWEDNMKGEIYDKLILERARRTAFISRFIVLEKGKNQKLTEKLSCLNGQIRQALKIFWNRLEISLKNAEIT